MYKYSLNLLPECIAHLCLRNDCIHEHNLRGCHKLRVDPGAKTFSNISERISNVPSNKINCDVSMSIFFFTSLHGDTPKYIQNLLNRYRPRRQLKSVNDILLILIRNKALKYDIRLMATAAAS